MSACNDAANTEEPSFSTPKAEAFRKISFGGATPDGLLDYCHGRKQSKNANAGRLTLKDVFRKKRKEKRCEIESDPPHQVLKTKVNVNSKQDTKSTVISLEPLSIKHES